MAVIQSPVTAVINMLIGVTTLSPETIEFPPTMSDLTLPGTWILSGSSIVQVCEVHTSVLAWRLTS